MPRRALALISGNIPYRKELSYYKGGVVLGFAGAGVIPPLHCDQVKPARINRMRNLV
jgi:hypothetical protein